MSCDTAIVCCFSHVKRRHLCCVWRNRDSVMNKNCRNATPRLEICRIWRTTTELLNYWRTGGLKDWTTGETARIPIPVIRSDRVPVYYACSVMRASFCRAPVISPTQRPRHVGFAGLACLWPVMTSSLRVSPTPTLPRVVSLPLRLSFSVSASPDSGCNVTYWAAPERAAQVVCCPLTSKF